MNNRKYIIAGVVAVLFTFAGYNLYSYFKTQQAIQLEQDQRAEQRRAARAEKVAQRETARIAAIAAAEKEAEAWRAVQELENAKAAAEQAKKVEEEEARLAQQEAERLAFVEEKRLRREQDAKDRLAAIRRPKHIEGMTDERIDQLNQISADYIRDHPREFLDQELNPQNMGVRRSFVKLLANDTNALMLYAAVSADLDVIKALVDIGFDLNAQNEQGYTALMFASAYNNPEVVRFLLGQGADPSITAHILNLNALHIASLFNPNPDSADVLVKAGMPLESLTENDYTPLLLAITENKNLEVAERLADLGADTKAYDEQGRSVYALAQIRMRHDGSDYLKISDAVNERILRKMR